MSCDSYVTTHMRMNQRKLASPIIQVTGTVNLLYYPHT